MMRCPGKQRLSEYLDGELSPEAAGRLDRHLDACKRCSERLAELRLVDDVLADRADADETADEPMPDVSAAVTETLRRRGAFFRARVTEAKRAVVGPRWPAGRWAAVFVLAAGILVGAYAGIHTISRDDWVYRTEPLLAEADRILITVEVVEPGGDQGVVLARVREELRELNLAEKLAGASEGAGSAVVGDLAALKRKLAVMTAPGDLPPELRAEVREGELRREVLRLRGRLKERM